ncbi:MAG: lipid A ethanolaminephosphotransferase [Motiliproteus sp.]|jgi:lipid A ethanolaminephosphotransferase
MYIFVNPRHKDARLSSTTLALILALYFFFVINIPIIIKLIGILRLNEELHWGFAISLPIFFIAVFNLLFNLFTLKYVAKPFFIVLLLISSCVSYVSYSYGIFIDSDMVRNIVDSHYGEAVSYLNSSALVWVLLMGGIPALLVYKAPLKFHSLPKELLYKGGSIALSILVVGAIAGLYYKDYAAVGRNNSYLNKMIIPTHYTYSIGKFINYNYIKPLPPYQQLGVGAHLATTKSTSQSATQSGRPNLLVMVIGETARGMNFGLNGYDRDTNAFTREQGVTSFKDVSSCGTATAVSLPCMFSRFGRLSFDKRSAHNQDNLMDVLQYAGLNTLWLENDGGCKGVCDRISTLEFSPEDRSAWCDGEYCKDEVLLENFQQALDRLKEKRQDSVLVLHLVGSHGPTYYQRYPENFSHFEPDCARSDIQNCSQAEIVNSYDNTIYHDDFILSKVIETLSANSADWRSGMLYISDHGESLGENGLYLHGMPYNMAPKEQTQVPLLTWFSPALQSQKQLDPDCLKHRANNEAFSQDNLFDSILGLMDVRTPLYQQRLDIFSPCRS